MKLSLFKSSFSSHRDGLHVRAAPLSSCRAHRHTGKGERTGSGERKWGHLCFHCTLSSLHLAQVQIFLDDEAVTFCAESSLGAEILLQEEHLWRDASFVARTLESSEILLVVLLFVCVESLLVWEILMWPLWVSLFWCSRWHAPDKCPLERD